MATPKRCSPSLNQAVDSLQERLKQGQNITNTLQERLKHGQNIADILENQISAAQKNLNFLQDQIHLANETVMSLKEHFHDAEEMLSTLVQSERLVNSHNSSHLKILDVSENMESSPCSPISSQTSPTLLSRPYDDRHEQKKSQYAQQLRQVLDVLQDESSSPQRSCTYYSNKAWRNGDQVRSSKKYSNSNRCDDDNEYFEDINRIDNNKRTTSSESFSRESKDQSRIKSSPSCFIYSRIHDNEIKEHSPNKKMLHSHSPSQQLYSDKPLYPPHHIYSRADNDFHDDISSRKKRSHGPGEEHLKYIKVKKIDGSKLTAQKTLLDFNKRRFLPYNPRYDLDLLIVPPPIPATELLKGNSLCYKKGIDNGQRFNSLETCKVYKKINGEISKINSAENKVLFTRYNESSLQINPIKKELEDISKTEEVKFKLKSNKPMLTSCNLLEEENTTIVVGGSRTQ